jgi:hypothetical protein
MSRRTRAASPVFDQWIGTFRTNAMARGITDETYARVMTGLRPDMTGLTAMGLLARLRQGSL